LLPPPAVHVWHLSPEACRWALFMALHGCPALAAFAACTGRWGHVLLFIVTFRGVCAEQARELPAVAYPAEGAAGPDTYLPNATLTTCSLLNPYPASATLPWNPSVETAKAFCRQHIHCGGLVYMTAAANSAAGNANLATAFFCMPQSFVAGAISSTSGVAFVRHIYGSCDLRINLTSTVVTHYGTLTDIRRACVRPGRGLTAARDRTPRPRTRKYAEPPKPLIQLNGYHYKVGEEVFVDTASAQNKSADGSTHVMISAAGVYYYMPGTSHALRNLAEKPFSRDGWYPLYSTEAGAQAAAIRAGFNGQAISVGPMSALGQPIKWTTPPHVQNLWMPSGTSDRLFYGDYVHGFALDGYFPLYRTVADAQKAATSGATQSHGPGSSTGHPLSWSTGETRLYYMPADGPTQYYGNYYNESLAAAGLYSHTAALRAPGFPSTPHAKHLSVGVNSASLSAAQVVAAEAMPTNTAAAASTLSVFTTTTLPTKTVALGIHVIHAVGAAGRAYFLSHNSSMRQQKRSWWQRAA